MPSIFCAIGSAPISFLSCFRCISRGCAETCAVGRRSLAGGFDPNASLADGDGDFDRWRDDGVLRLRDPLLPVVWFTLSSGRGFRRVGVESRAILYSRSGLVCDRCSCMLPLVGVVERARPRVSAYCRERLWSLGADPPAFVAAASASSSTNLPLGLALPNATRSRAGERALPCTFSRAL